MTALTLIATGHPLAFPVATYSRDREKAWHRLLACESAWRNSETGETDKLFELTSAWLLAIDDYEAARARHEEAVRRAQGRCGLRVLMGGRS